jgi:pimeloyl-ACP methyl ester carboxylesterase
MMRRDRALPVLCSTLLALAACQAGSGGAPAGSAGQERPARPERVSIPTRDGGLLSADLYGSGPRGVVLAHGGRFNKESWEKQARALATAGYRVLAFDFRGYGESRGPGQKDVFTAPLHLDVLASVHHLRRTGATTVAAIGGSMGGGAAAEAVLSEPGAIDRLILVGATPDGPADKLIVRSSTS